MKFNYAKPDDVARVLGTVVSRIDSILSQREEIRDAMIKKSREIIRYSGWAINALLRGSINEAKEHIERLKDAVKEFMEYARKDQRLYYSGLVDSTLAEYVEAMVLYGLTLEGRLYTPDELDVHEVAYLQGLGDAIGELRRLALDKLRYGDVDEAERLLEIMETIYNIMRTLEYPDALMPGVKHKVDVARRLIDDTKALLIEVKGRITLMKTLEEVGDSGRRREEGKRESRGEARSC